MDETVVTEPFVCHNCGRGEDEIPPAHRFECAAHGNTFCLACSIVTADGDGLLTLSGVPATPKTCACGEGL